MRIRRSIQKMKKDPLTVIIALNSENKSKGIIYFDDEESFDYKKEKYSILEINYNNKEIEFEWKKYNYEIINNIEKIVIIGEDELELFSDKTKAELMVKNNKIYNLEIIKDFEKKKIEIIRLNKYKLTEMKKIKLIQ